MEEASPLVELFLPIGLAVIMATLGLSLRVENFKRVLTAPRGVAIGLGNLLLISPLLAFLVAEVFGLDPLLAVGLVLLGASPGGTMANLLTHLARGETALSVTMTAVSSVAAVVTVPLFLGLAIAHFDAVGLTNEVSLLGIVLRVFLITLIPLAIGMSFAARAPERARALEPRLKRVALVVFIGIIAAAVFEERALIVSSFAIVGPAAVALNIAAMSISFAVARLGRLSDRQATAIAMELGIHNSTLTITVAAAIDTRMAIPAAVYSVFMWVTAGWFAAFMKSRNAPFTTTPEGAAVQYPR